MSSQPSNFPYVLLLQVLLFTLTTCRTLPESEEFDITTCVWDDNNEYCKINPEALFLILENSDNEFAHMMRCPQITNQNLCNNLQPDTCYWENGSCKLRSTYFLRQVLSCAVFEDSEEQEELLNLLDDQFNDTFIEEIQYLLDEITPLSFDPPSHNHVCHLIQTSIDCYGGVSDSNDRCATAVTYMLSSLFQIQNYIGQFELSLIGRQWPRSIISIHEVSQDLGFGEKETLENFDRCINLNKQECDANQTLLSDTAFPWMQKLRAEPNSRQVETQGSETDDADNSRIRVAAIVPLTIILAFFLGILLYIMWRRYNVVSNRDKQ